jgi:hypothetical protein
MLGQYKLGKTLGIGAFGKVKCKYDPDNLYLSQSEIKQSHISINIILSII